MQLPKISIIGAGNVGTQTAFLLASKSLANIVLIDINESHAKGKALDLTHATSLLESSSSIIGGKDYSLIQNSNIVVITAGIPRKPGMSRDDLIDVNAKIVKDVITNVKKYAPHSILILVTNPLDEMVYLAKKLSGFPKERIMGMAGVLDTARFTFYIAQELNVFVHDISTIVLGGHGDSMVPLPRLTTIKEKSLTAFLSEKKINELVEKTRNAGAEVIQLLQTGSAFIAPAASLFVMIQSILLDEKKTLPCSAELQGEYGQKDVFIGVPCILGKKGVEKIIELKLNTEEKNLFLKTVQHIKSLHPQLEKYC